MAKTVDQIVKEIIGEQAVQIARLTAVNQALVEENAALKAAAGKISEPAP
jgi:hypothetical protein